jgi:hypothetical protein
MVMGAALDMLPIRIERERDARVTQLVSDEADISAPR